MSSSLVRKGLELFADDIESAPGSSNGALSFKKKRGPHSLRKNDLMKEIGTNRKGVKKQLNRIKHREARRPTAKEGKIKSSIDTYLKSQPVDCTQANVELLLNLSRSNPTTSRNYSKILQHSRGRSARDATPKDDEPKDTPFTEEDFALFEKEYTPKKKDLI